MAKKYIVLTSVQARDKAGKKVIIPRSPEPQDIPAGLVKELLARGAIEESKDAAVTKPAQPFDSGGDDDESAGSGDDASGD